MTVDRPHVEEPAPGVLLIRYEWREQLEAAWQGELLTLARAAAASGPVALVFVLAERLREIPPTVRVFWRTAVADRGHGIAAVGVVTRSWGVEVNAMGFGVTNTLSGASVRVETFREEGDAVAWAASQARPAMPAAAGG
ncbi:MAG: hypothetical protein NDI82_07100 [Anaeromyxobacteraceae bacterium]|nr:hypothetical protein [Anaeromyxobacteraceae bacterium]